MDDHQERKLRAEFEIWFSKSNLGPAGLMFRRLIDNSRYESMATEYGWLGFKEGRRSTPARDMQGRAEDARDAALRVFADAYRPEAERLADFGATPDLIEFLDRNRITPGVTMGDFRRAYEAIYGAHPGGSAEGGK